MQRKAQSEQFCAASLAGQSRGFWLTHPTLLYSCFSSLDRFGEQPQAGGQGAAGFLPSVQ